MTQDHVVTEEVLHDVIVVGYGPGGEVAAATLGAAGADVVALERYVTPYPLPRMVTFDAEACRALAVLGVDMNKALANSTVLHGAPYLDPQGEALFTLDWTGEQFGFARRRSIFQPEVEEALDDRVQDFGNVDVRRGSEVIGIEELEDRVRLTVRDSEGVTSTLAARWVIGADGANSFVREHIAPPELPFDYRAMYLNFDAKTLRPLPERFGKFQMYMDPSRPYMSMPIGTRRQRFEIDVWPEDSEEELLDPETPWRILADKWGLGRDDVEITRQVIYRYRSRMSDRWRSGRLFLVGDAAHSMAPTMGQGGCSAIRDARNLAWKLSFVIDGLANESILDTYESEMKPFVTEIVKGSELISRFAHTNDRDKAADRDRALRSGQIPAPVWPHIQTGLLSTAGSGAARAIGRPAPQGRLLIDGIEALGDQFLGAGFQLVATSKPELTDHQWDELRRLNFGIALIGGEPGEANAARDLDNTYGAYLDEHSMEFYISRPDAYVYGGGALRDCGAVVDELFAALTR